MTNRGRPMWRHFLDDLEDAVAFLGDALITLGAAVFGRRVGERRDVITWRGRSWLVTPRNRRPGPWAPEVGSGPGAPPPPMK